MSPRAKLGHFLNQSAITKSTISLKAFDSLKAFELERST